MPSDHKELNPAQQRLLAQIEQAFAGVELGEGVSMHEAEWIDDHGTAEQRKAGREPDEKFDWHKVVDDPYPTQYTAFWCFLDAAGTRFYLPACMTRVVRDHDRTDKAAERLADYMALHLHGIVRDGDGDRLADSYRKQLSLLNAEQKACVREVLIYLREIALPFTADREMIDCTINDGYWLERAPS